MAHVICKSELVERCRAFAKALHYKEMEFEGALSKKMDANPVAVVEALIHTNTQGCVWFAFRYTHNPKRGVVLVSVNRNTQGMLVFGSRFTATPQSGVWLRLSHHRLLNGDLNSFSVNTCVLVELIFQLLSSIKGAYFQVIITLEYIGCRDIDIRSTAFGCGTEGIMVWQAILAVMSLVLPPTEDSETWLKFASLCWKRGRVDQVKSTLIKLLQVCKIFFSHPSISLASVCLSSASSIFLFGFGTWMVVEHDKIGHRLDSLNEMFWLMTFLESASLIGIQVLANWLISSNDIHKNMVSPSTATAILALLCIIYIARE
ncbi:Major facilitator superfamily domain, general substrate transporter [Artemisia annua]|uniref:Major facilitator superfamily domain, general substrate transporter n=1 Tax=Artemisia annua TaxID=35608 RepID=A0A2U1NGP5_ARTAN|nr:Major facilitator superfamily domain, general substrate transporter [Artemisia annua]